MVLPVFKILLTNDDGLESLGIRVLIDALSKENDIFVRVIAPSSEKSAVAKSLTFHKPLRLIDIKKEENLDIYEITGTPADAVLFGITHKDFERPDLVISGVNLGLNLCMHSILTSGTVAAAIEASIQGIPAIAMSMETKKQYWFSTKRSERYKEVIEEIVKFVIELVEIIKNKGFPTGIDILNINFPEKYKYSERKLKVTRPCRSRFVNYPEKRLDPRGVPYFWIAGNEIENIPENTDLNAIKNGFVSITPIILSGIVPNDKIVYMEQFLKNSF